MNIAEAIQMLSKIPNKRQPLLAHDGLGHSEIGEVICLGKGFDFNGRGGIVCVAKDGPKGEAGLDNAVKPETQL
jgi:hypothetical protein